MKRFVSVLIVLSLVLGLAACGGSPASSQTSAAEETVLFTDDLGREVTVSQPPERVAALIGSFADILSLSPSPVT